MSEKLKKRIEELENTYRFIEDNLLDSIWVVDADTLKYEYITPNIKKMSGYTAEEFLSLTMKDNLSPESLDKALLIMNEERKEFSSGNNNLRTMEMEVIAKDGSHYWVEIRAKFYQEKGQPLKVVGITKNINERKNQEKKQEELIKELQKTIIEKERLLDENKVLKGLLPICSGCKRIRDENGKWWPFDTYVTKKTQAQLTHTMCFDCIDVYYNEEPVDK